MIVLENDSMMTANNYDRVTARLRSRFLVVIILPSASATMQEISGTICRAICGPGHRRRIRLTLDRDCAILEIRGASPAIRLDWGMCE